MRVRRWFLPTGPDVIGLLRAQIALTVEGIDDFAAWAADGGDPGRAEQVRAIEHDADDAKRRVQRALRAALVTPMEPEDVFTISQAVDWILNHAKDAIREAEVMDAAPDAALGEMAAHLATAVRCLADAVAAVEQDPEAATVAANLAIKEERRLERAYRVGMASLLEVEDLRDVIARRELYRRCSRMGETAVLAAERVIYATLKES